MKTQPNERSSKTQYLTSVLMDKEENVGVRGEEKKHHIKGKRIVWEKEQIHERGAAGHLL